MHTEAIDDHGAVDLYADMVRLAIHDLQRGPGFTPKHQRDYQSAVAFLDRAGLLQRVTEHHGLDLGEHRLQLDLFAA